MNRTTVHLIWMVTGVIFIAIIAGALDVGDTADCSDGQIIKVNGTVWACDTDSTGNGTGSTSNIWAADTDYNYLNASLAQAINVTTIYISATTTQLMISNNSGVYISWQDTG